MVNIARLATYLLRARAHNLHQYTRR
jgi:hypothetical protein